jgi:hypothetical protein
MRRSCYSAFCILAFDGDAARKPEVGKALSELARYLQFKGARVEYLHLPDTSEKTGLDDYLIGHSVEDLWRLVKPNLPAKQAESDSAPVAESAADCAESVALTPISITEAHKVFHRWLGKSFDTDALDIMLASAKMADDEGDPVWVMFLSGSGNAKTEMVQSLSGIRAEVTSAISSAGALLSATAKKDKAADATGGLLPKLHDEGIGILVLKDFTTILSMNRNVREEVISALREVHDGYYKRNVGVDGGKTLTWKGRLVVIGACTTAYDRAYAVISVMGNRFVLVRIDSENDASREEFGLQSIANLGSEKTMRRSLAETVAAVLAGSGEPAQLTQAEGLVLVRAANLATKVRTAVESDYRGDVEDAHAPEAPTRFVKQLAQIVRGSIAIGIDRAQAMKLAIRCARDSLPPMRLAILGDLNGAGYFQQSTAADVAKRIDKPRTSVDRQLQALHALGLATVKPNTSPWDYSLKPGVNPKVLDPESCPEMLVQAHRDIEKRESDTHNGGARHPTNISGQDADQGLPGLTDVSGNGEQPASQHCSICDRPLLHPASIQRGYCERCNIDSNPQQCESETS